MAKRTHGTRNNQNRKEHRNGIKRPKKHRLIETPGMHPTFMKNLIRSRKGNTQTESE